MTDSEMKERAGIGIQNMRERVKIWEEPFRSPAKRVQYLYYSARRREKARCEW